MSIDDFGESVSIFSEKTKCMMTSDMIIQNNSDNYVLCKRRGYSKGDSFFVLLPSTNEIYNLNSSCPNSTNWYPEEKQIYHTSKFF